MNGCTINIADFQALRAMNGHKMQAVPANINRSCTVITLDPANESSAHAVELMNDPSASVLDIGEARGIHHRTFSGPSPVQRRARVLSFGHSEGSRSTEQRGVKCWTCNADPIDCPPAA